ncbi:MAG: hypothetical protein U5K31_10690 [Balneolaceae bacterium]|nr:hypothetical protein [Balneolaceae bacterium]
MSADTKELKELLHESIENIDDEAYLQTVKELLDRKYKARKITLSSHQINRIEEAKNSIEQGDYLSNEQADELVKKWLNE